MKAWKAALIGGLAGWAAGLLAWIIWPTALVGLAPTAGAGAGALAAGWWQMRRNERKKDEQQFHEHRDRVQEGHSD